MKVFFTASNKNKSTFQENYNFIINTLRTKKIDITSLETGSYDQILSKSFIKNRSIEEIHYEYTCRAISKAHAVIIEASSNSFQLGHEATLALLYNKPVLCLSSNKDYSSKIKHPMFKASKYSTNTDIEKALEQFLRKYENKFLTIRFNTFISPEQKNFLDQIKRTRSICSSEYIRELINREMKNY